MQNAAATNTPAPSRLSALVKDAEQTINSAKSALSQDQLPEATRMLEQFVAQSVTTDTRMPAYLGTELWKPLRNYGMKNGPDGLRAAERMLAGAVAALPDDAPRAIRRNARRNLSLLRAVIGVKIPESEALDHIIATTSEEVAPLTWGSAQLQLGTLHLVARRTTEALECFEAALRVYSKQAYPLRWAQTRIKMAEAQQQLQAPQEAVLALKDALTVLSESQEPDQWAATQSALGDAIMDTCDEDVGKTDIWTLVKAIAAYREAMRIYRRGTRPGDWARVQERLSHVELALADHPSSGIVRPHIRAALHHVQNALAAYDSNAMTDASHIERLKSFAMRIEKRLEREQTATVQRAFGRSEARAPAAS